MPKINSTLATFAIASVLAASIASTVLKQSWTAGAAHAQTAAEVDSNSVIRARWAASATGRIEPKSGEVKVSAETGGLVVEIPVATNAQVRKGDILVKLDADDAWQRVVAARSEVEVRKRERSEEEATGPALDRRRAEDALADAERSLFDDWRKFDDTAERVRAGDASEADLADVRKAVDEAQTLVRDERKNFAKVAERSDMPLPTRLETSLTIARAELSMAENAYEKMRVRAPFDGTVLNVIAREGEIATPGPQSPLVLFGNVSGLRVRAEVEERDVSKIRVGQKVVIKADAYPDREFTGAVTEIASALGSPRIASRGPRRPNDVDVLEVVADLDGSPPLLTGMRVDVFFKKDQDQQSSVTTGMNNN